MQETILTRIKTMGNRPSTGWLVFILAFCSRIIQLIFFYNTRFDGSYQYIAAQSFLKGHGVSIPYVSGVDLSHIIYEPLVKWPPGYSWMLSPFLAMFPHNYVAAGLCMEILAAFLLLIAIRSILLQLDLPRYWVNTGVLISGFFIHYFYLVDSSDAIGIAFLFAALSLCLKWQKAAAKTGYHLTLILLCLFLAAAMKYLYVPLVFIPVLLLILHAHSTGNRTLRNGSIWLFVLLSIAVGALLAWQKIQSGQVAYISQSGRGFFPGHLKDMYPFIPAAFLQPETVSGALGLPGETGSLVYWIFQFITLIMALMGVWIFLPGIKHWRGKLRTPAQWFAWNAFFMIMALCLVLITLSLTVQKEEIQKGYFWTYVEDARYYGPAIVLLQLGLLVFMASNKKKWKSRFGGMAILLFCFLLIETLHGFYFDLNRIYKSRKEQYSWEFEWNFQQAADNVIQTALRAHPGSKAVVTGPGAYMNNRVSLFSQVPVLSERESWLNLRQFKASSPVIVMTIVSKIDAVAHKAESGDPAGEFDQYYFYTYYVQ